MIMGDDRVEGQNGGDSALEAGCGPSSACTLDLGHRMALTCWAPDPDTLRARLSFGKRVVGESSFTSGRPRWRWRVATRVMRAEFAVVVDVFAGELRVCADVAVHHRARGGSWRQLIDLDEVTVVCFGPSVGRVGGSTAVHAPVFEDASWGHSLPCSPAILRFFVDDRKRWLVPVGQLAKDSLFPEHPPFVFNTVACVGGGGGGDRRYNDPDSPWFNVFFGYYQLDCAKVLWSRPFGYRSAAGERSMVEGDDLLRLGMADWNWFSNWMYGIPGDIARRYSSLGTSRATVSDPEVRPVGSKRWHRIRLQDVEVASCHQGSGQGARRLVKNSPLAPVWRQAFGPPIRRQPALPSFVPTTLDAVCDLSYWEDDDYFHTIVFGATALSGTEPGFLAAQLGSLQAVIQGSYSDLGFP